MTAGVAQRKPEDFREAFDSPRLSRQNCEFRSEGFPSGHGGVPERSKGADCKSAGHAFEGSNPSPSTIGLRRRGDTKAWQEIRMVWLGYRRREGQAEPKVGFGPSGGHAGLGVERV